MEPMTVNGLKEWFSLCHCHLGIGQVFSEDSQPVKINLTNQNMCKNQISPVVQSSECIHPNDHPWENKNWAKVSDKIATWNGTYY